MVNAAEKEDRSFREGLEDVVAAESSICFIDGQRGILSYRGYDIHDLADRASFGEVCHLLWDGRLPTPAELSATRAALGAERGVPEPVLALARRELAGGMVPMDALRTAISALAEGDPDVASNAPDANRRKAVRLTARLATLVAAIRRFREGREPVSPDPRLGHAEDFLRMSNGAPPTPGMTRAFDIALVLHADHELNASTFAARVTAATLSDMHSAVVAAIGTLKGPLHGGANEAVYRMLLEIGDPSRVDAAIRARLAAHQKIMGFGHRVYTTEDPRATHLRRMSQELAVSTGDARLWETSRRIELLVKEEKRLNCNVDFYSASVYAMLGIPHDLFTPIFALSRCAGWTAHVMEQHEHNRLIRPRADYIGPAYPQRWVPLAER